jgi:hypothetical protein
VVEQSTLHRRKKRFALSQPLEGSSTECAFTHTVRLEPIATGSEVDPFPVTLWCLSKQKLWDQLHRSQL